ncbi:MAG: metallothionein [Myxococcaceae bacterium]
MARSLLTAFAVVAGLALSLGAAPALACEGDPACTCAHGKEAKDGKDLKKKAVKADEKKPAPAPSPEVKPAPAKQGSVLHELDELIAAKCSCTSAADCTCKKGQCKCPKCGGHQQSRMFDSLKGAQDLLKVPDNARRDATAGVFI